MHRPVWPLRKSGRPTARRPPPWGFPPGQGRFIERVRLADGHPVSFDQTWLPEGIGAQVASEDLSEEPIFRLLEDKYGIPLVEATYRLEAIVADDALGDRLETEPGAPVLRVARTTFTTGQRPIDYELLHYRGDLISFATRLTREPPA